MLAVAGCGGQQGKLEIRSTPTPLAQGQRAVPYRIAEARGQLALGNVALALEAFRLAQREDPNNPDALVGIATCYDQMGRFDLSRRNYEAALALAPSSTEILGALASSLQLQGRTEEALGVRQEIAARAAASAALEQAVAEVPAPMRSAPETEAVQTAAAAPAVIVPVEPVQVAAAPAVETAPAPRTWAAAPVALSVSTPERVGVDVPAIQTARVEMVAEAPAPVPAETAAAPAAASKPAVQTAAVGRSVTIKLPPPRPVQSVPASKPAAAVPLAPAMPLDEPPQEAVFVPLKPYVRPVAEPVVAEERGPRLERMSMGEIALITVPKPVWQPTTVARNDRTTTLRFVPLRQAYALPVKVRLLNAARVDRLAARTRVWLAARGWRGLSIGNAQATRTRSVILYPANQRALAQRLSAQFGFPIARRASGSHMVVLLGTDAASRKALRTVRT
ncbi:LytR C-terminal domain-containing protein [Sphingomonas sediminicola]|uniref:LytR C-terminal domain-containing protein n=2 Tax=Sphingomonas sediminicola TaxID=386874 RepID=A0ABX6T9I9_9SPHN|nr:LytR C-terminal domain-containing protein [Sphingomonas sediminicola]QNP46209.1 LytR C-terminal domain-containing protein [Sphingomonas sediminicola]